MNTKHEEALVITMEEAAEVIQECSKVLRFGKTTDNLDKEVGDLICLLDILVNEGIINKDIIERSIEQKLSKLSRYSDHLGKPQS